MRISDWSSDVCSSDLILHGAHGGFARAEILRAVGRDRDEAEAREIVAERDIDRRTALGVERDIAFPEQDGTEIIAGQARQVAATAAAGIERLAAGLALTHHMPMRARGWHDKGAVANTDRQSAPLGS